MSDDYTNQEPVEPHIYTKIEGVGYQCNDCGAYAETEDEVQHYPTCQPGESARWEKKYEEAFHDDEFDAEYYGDHQYDGVDLGDEPDDEWYPGSFYTPQNDDPNPYEGTLSDE